MSGSENGGNGSTEQRQVGSPGRVLGARSASPAKRSAADMEGGDKSAAGGGGAPGSFAKEQDGAPSDYDVAMAGMTPANDESMDTQETVPNSMDTSVQASMTTNTSATSFQSDAPPPYSAEDALPPRAKSSTDYTTEEIDMQESTVRQKQTKQLDEGQKGRVVSIKWLARVLSRSSEGLKDNKYPKEAREGPIGPVDNADIVPEGAFKEPFLKDIEGRDYIPLRPGLAIGQDYEIFTDEAWGEIAAKYGAIIGQKPIERYVRNTTEAEAAYANLQYEVYPPIFTVRKVPQPKPAGDEEEQRPGSSSSSVVALRLRTEQYGRGQNSPDDALRLVSSRQERFQKFLARSKQAAGIPRSTKVKVFKMLDPSKVDVDKPQTGVMSPPASRGTSPKRAQPTTSKLVVDLEAFNKMEIGKDLEPIDAKDETNNSNYNGASNMGLHVLVEDTTLLLEEQVGGPGGGEFVSDKKKISNLFNRTKKDSGSKPGSATASGRTSPALGGMVTRGRARRDGRTRGTVGLTNLGNTCYMNSALQCIRSVEELAIYFLSEKYKKDINVGNPLGHHGAMAKQYANLLHLIYSDTTSGAITPSTFKKLLGTAQPMFSGYGQQDSQEFLSFLVDALHEDLNRILKKPYNENPDSDDNTVRDPQAIIDLGEVYRKNHKARNDSVATDLFSGFYKNTMECPDCDKVSITFDPYSLVTVQLPVESTFQHTVTFVPRLGRPINHAIDIDKNATIKMLKENVASKHAGVQPDRLLMVEVYSHKIYKVFEDKTSLAEASIQPNDYLFVFELEDVPSNPPPPEKKTLYSSYNMYNNKSEDKVPEMDDAKADRFAVPVFSRQKNRYGSAWDIIMHPMYVVVTRDEAKDFDTILKKVLIAVSRLTSLPILTENDESADVDSAANEVQRDGPVTDENAQVNDTSSSEDGYVKVSVDNTESAQQNGDVLTNGTTKDDSAADDRPVPSGFMDPQYFISPSLRNQLFAMNYAQSESGMHCTGMASFQERSIRNMFDRVKLAARRGSTQSTSSGEESTTSTGSGAQLNGDAEESDADDQNKPDITLGDESALGIPATPIDADDSDNELPSNPLASMSRKGRRNNKKNNKKGRRGQKTYATKGKRGQFQGRPNSAGSQRSLGGKWNQEEDNPYYIKLGEGIVLDWYPEALDSLFNGDANNDEDTRGQYVSSADGKGLPFIKDPEVEAKKYRRELRKKNGISLEDCFVETGKREVLSEDNAWYCNRCKEMRRAAKTLEIWTMPDILVVHLKRFGGNRSFRDKIDVFVDYPIEGLDMTQRVGLKEDGKEYLYDLFAVDNHYGGLGGGHYTAMAKNFYDGQWYDYNAYLLFYRRRSDKPLGPQYLQDLVMEARNPQQAEPAAEETAEESDSGEGRLGGPNGSLLGSSGGSIGAGVGAESRRAGSGLAGVGLGAGSSLMTRTNQVNEIEGAPVFGPKRPPHMEYGHIAEPSWNFDGLSDAVEANGDAERLIDNVNSVNADDDDAASTTAEMGNMGDDDFARSMDEEFSSFENTGGSNWSTAGYTTPVEDSFGTYDDHHLYSSAHEHQDDTLHLEDAGLIGQHEENDPETVHIYPGPPDMD
ncbi:hypothetical protein LTR37_005073 [Vermiconidia calcicola]|uniref:Uncharacterized protein n=1 Tax=Vermiconidia calcicola TaxID=1690605 RepID=A0ACC3NKU3_9PEZI|nr:hypothetical protein LTR37_005073 [Vermiconidia calcicola]